MASRCLYVSVADIWCATTASAGTARGRTLGPVAEEAKKTSIHLVLQTAFAGVATRRTSLVLTLKSATDIRSPRVEKREQTSANRWHVEVRLNSPAEVDRQLTAWLRAAYDLAGP